MVGAAFPAVMADANTLYSAALRDILIDLSLAKVIRLHWSPAIEVELGRALMDHRADYTPTKVRKLFQAMNAALSAASVSPSADINVTAQLPDPDAIHVVAAALYADCSIILTFNLADFPANQLLREGNLTAMHPDTFLVSLLTTNAAPVVSVIDGIRRRLAKPPMKRDAYCDGLHRSALPQTASLLRIILEE
jgi:hypothetical protein